jgi:heptosyltransferase III
VKNIQSVIISRTDNLGDVALTLPLCGILKSIYPKIKISFLGKAYTKPLILQSKYVDEFIDREEVINKTVRLKADAIVYVFPDEAIAMEAFKAGIKIRIGTSHRWFHWFTCNKLVNFSRINSSLHETLLNIKLLKPLGVIQEYELAGLEKYYGFDSFERILPKEKVRIILHPKSKGSAREWDLNKYFHLASQLDKSKYEIFVTGTKAEGDKIIAEMSNFFTDSGAIDMTGKFSLEEFIDFIKSVDVLIACSTGPLHIAAAFGKQVIGFYPSIKPMHAGRWKPIGKHVKVFELEKNCVDCKKSLICACINSFEAREVKEFLVNNLN